VTKASLCKVGGQTIIHRACEQRPAFRRMPTQLIAVQVGGKERYIFFSFPHISIGAAGNIGAAGQQGQAGSSGGCDVLEAALIDMKRQGLSVSCTQPGGAHFGLDMHCLWHASTQPMTSTEPEIGLAAQASSVSRKASATCCSFARAMTVVPHDCCTSCPVGREQERWTMKGSSTNFCSCTRD